ncbi:MAG: acyl-CoA synthetase [Desulfobacteraceae bacterium]|jgi:long-chain acyl-CoA synthetase|nr:MAG: acyl-CoA synthetase [Desulfobacteraceae bacterium]
MQAGYGRILLFSVELHHGFCLLKEFGGTMNISDIVRKSAEERPDHNAVIFGDRLITYRELDDFIDRFASGIARQGLGKGEVLSIFLPSLPELIISYLGAARAGLTVNLVNAMLMEKEVAYILNDCGSRAVVVDRRRLHIIEAIRSKEESIDTIVLLEDTVNGEEYLTFNSILEKGREDFTRSATKGSDLCHLMYTSGTTGWPKGVMATHLNIRHNASSFGKIHFRPDDIIMVATPIFHCWGLVNGTLGMLSRGGTVITVERFHPAQTLADIERLKPTIFIGVPPMYNLILKEPDLRRRDISSVIFCLSAATKMPENLIHQVQEKLGWRYAEAWGLTEVSCVGATAHYAETRIGACGKGMDDAELKVIDEKGVTLPPFQQGELCIKGTCVTRGYLNKPDVTNQVFDADGWFHSGDIAYMDKDGYAYIVDRKKDMINVGGEKVFPSEVEDMMLSHPKIKDIVIVGVPHELKGEAPKAFVVLKDGESSSEEEIQSFCRGLMAPYKVPVAVEFLDEIPRLASGKALRRRLRDREWKKVQV